MIRNSNPATGEALRAFAPWGAAELEAALAATAQATTAWQATSFIERAQLLRRVAAELRTRASAYAELITQEMGKLISEARAEIEKCARGCDYFADHAESFLADEKIASDAGRSYVAYLPLGTVLAIMPWNFPFWQVFRFAAPALMAGNTAVLKHASNVPQCAMAIEQVFRTAGFPAGTFRALMITSAEVAKVIADPRIHAITLTGSDVAGQKVAAVAGSHLKKTVLELGGSDAFVVLADADLEEATTIGVAARFQNSGQSCIAAKRFILVPEIADDYLALFKRKVQALRVGDPMAEDTQIAPLARADLREQLHQQVTDAITRGALVVIGCKPLDRPGNFYAPSILDQVEPGMRVYHEEVFGPVALVIRARDEADALRIANDSRYGLGASVWTGDIKKGEAFARRLQSGASFVNGMVKSDPRLPFGGIKASGYGRELSLHGIREFTNVKTIWIK